ncbi:MAG: hypothetical protein FWF66_02010 [Candidatus Bathyarchaeota archaeon]|nr:hypothetical protein [Candidatus Termiticorpusculum sp.]MCL1970223.1 hypothetical protein [Candidatus Termiticorpusculum sp.]
MQPSFSPLFPLSVESIWSLDPQSFVELLDSNVFMQKNRNVHFYTPNFTCTKNSSIDAPQETFPSISITGTKCALKCKHCKGHLLNTMYPATTPDDLFKLCCKLQQDHQAVGCLISGGCLPNGTVPLKPFITTIAKIRHKLNFTVFIHTGLIDIETATLLKQTDAADAILIDIIGSQEIINNIYQLNATVQDYAKTLEILQRTKLNFVPHITVGLNNGVLDGEYNALQMISKTKPSAIVIIALTPISKTDMEKTRPPQPYDIARVIATARTIMPKTPIILGCMRPKNRQCTTTTATTDVLALKAGVNAIAFPDRATINYAKTHGWITTFSPYCCAKIGHVLSSCGE